MFDRDLDKGVRNVADVDSDPGGAVSTCAKTNRACFRRVQAVRRDASLTVFQNRLEVLVELVKEPAAVLPSMTDYAFEWQLKLRTQCAVLYREAEFVWSQFDAGESNLRMVFDELRAPAQSSNSHWLL